jgi:hypothetical protein
MSSAAGNPVEKHLAWWDSKDDRPITLGVRSRRDGAVIAAILGLFAVGWFGWGLADASGALKPILAVGMSTAVAMTVLATIRATRSPRSDGAMHDPTVRRRYGIIVGVEFALAFVGVVVLSATGAPAYGPVWICAVVGIHFFPLAAVFRDPTLRWLGAAVTAVAAAALLTGAFTEVAPGSVTGPGAGSVLIAFATLVLMSPSRPRVAESSRN